MAQVFEIAFGPGRRHIVVDVGVFLNCPDCAAGLGDSELAYVVREFTVTQEVLPGHVARRHDAHTVEAAMTDRKERRNHRAPADRVAH
jgi:hypothetical protein